MEKTMVNGRRRFVRKGKWGRAIRRMDRQTKNESLKDLKALDGIRRRGLKRGLLAGFLILLLGGAAAFYFVFDVGSWQRLDLQKIVMSATNNRPRNIVSHAEGLHQDICLRDF